MNTLKKITAFSFVATMFLACGKNSIPPPNTVVGQPVFSFAGTINSNNVNWQAGVNNYYMYSSYSRSAAGVYSFTGNLQNTSTTKNSIQITINDYKVSASNAPAVIDTSLVPAYYSLNKPGGNPTSYIVNFFPGPNGPPTSYLWAFGDGGISTVANPSHTYSHPGDYHISLSAQFPGCGYESDSNIIKMGTPDANTNILGFTISKDSLGDGRKMDFIAAYIGTPANIIWYFGDGKDTTMTLTAKHEYVLAGMYMVTCKITDADGNTSVFNENIVTSGYSQSCVNNYGEIVSPQTDSLLLSDVTINYTDGDGNVYTSNDSGQPSSSSFQITSVSDYQKNTSNETTKMLKVKFSCLLYCSTANPYVINASGTAVMAVAYPSQ